MPPKLAKTAFLCHAAKY